MDGQCVTPPRTELDGAYVTPPRMPLDDEDMELDEEDLMPVSADEVDLAVEHLKRCGTRMLALGNPSPNDGNRCS